MNQEKVVVTISSRIVGETGDFLRAAGPFLYLAAYTRSHGWGDAVMITLLWMINSFPFQMVTLLGTILLMAKRQMASLVNFQCLTIFLLKLPHCVTKCWHCNVSQQKETYICTFPMKVPHLMKMLPGVAPVEF